MAEQIAFMHQSGSIPGIPGVFPGGCSVRYDDYTREVLEVKPFGFVETPAQEDKPDENATQPLESPMANVETALHVDVPTEISSDVAVPMATPQEAIVAPIIFNGG